jgi:hypothetical protein
LLRAKLIGVHGLHGNITRHFPDTAFNFSFIVSAFAGGEPDTTVTDSTEAGWTIGIGSVSVSASRFTYFDNVAGVDLVTRIGELRSDFRKFDPGNFNVAARSLRLHNCLVAFSQLPALDTTGPALAWPRTAPFTRQKCQPSVSGRLPLTLVLPPFMQKLSSFMIAG